MTKTAVKTKPITIRISRTKANDMNEVSTVEIEITIKELALNDHIKTSRIVVATSQQQHKVVINKSHMTRANTSRVKDSALIRSRNTLLSMVEVTKVNNNPIIINNSSSGHSNNIPSRCTSSLLNSNTMAAQVHLPTYHLILT